MTDMMIRKYNLGLADEIGMHLPVGAKTLHAGFDPDGELCLWAYVDPSAPDVHFTFKIYSTGQLISERLPQKYIGTVSNSSSVWHIYQVTA